MKERRERNFRILEFRENKFDIIGDVHGCYDELIELIGRLGYEKKDGCYTHPEGRRLISVGDVADKGCQNLACLDFWIEQVNNGGAFWVHATTAISCTVIFWGIVCICHTDWSGR